MVTRCQDRKNVWYQKAGTLKIRAKMKKDDRIGIRVPRQVKEKLTQIALKEGRSLAQLCQIFLVAGVASYETHGAKYLQRFVAQLEKK